MIGEEKVKNDYNTVGDDIKSYGFGHRQVQIFLIFTIMSMGYVIRTSMSVSVIAMTDTSNNSTFWEVYEWDKKTQDYILSSFFWGYMIMQIPAGQMTQKLGGKILLVCAMVANGLIFLALPIAIRMGGWKAAFVLRALQGLTQSCMMPSIHTLLGKWAPVNERSRLGNFVIAGGPFGTIIGMPLSGFLCQHYGWPVTFQLIGAMAITMGFIWFWFGSDSPAKHQKISNEEKLYIQTSLGQTSKPKILKTPWKSFATSVPFWALLCTHIGCNWSFVTLLLEIPSYMKMALGINMQQSGLYSAMPFIAMWLFGMFISVVADYLINQKIFTITTTRKFCNTIGTWGTGSGLIILSYIPTSNVIWCLTILTVSVGMSSACNVGLMMNHIDLAPNFAGVMMGITNSISNAIGVFAPISVGQILKDTSDPIQWRMVFFITVIINSAMNLVFLIFGSAEKQDWNEPELLEDVEFEERKLNENIKSEQLK
ncbi:putative inorganic phosphate cotransporter [Arctopsyche grandis]|uniref:putative inorganic phosphate cotransporter n=1 Tax=Arctopsyche grandis TaxID=121162 RepID=UPI00406D743D